MALEVMDTKIKVTCLLGEVQSTERNIATHSSSIVINAFLSQIMQEFKNRFLDILHRMKGQYPFFFRSAENMSQTPL